MMIELTTAAQAAYTDSAEGGPSTLQQWLASAPTGPTDSSSAADVPMAVPLYGAAMLLDE